MNHYLRDLARALGGDFSKGQILCPGPGHSAADRSLSVKFIAGAPNGFVVHSFAGDDPISCRDHVKRLLGIGRDRPYAERSAPLGSTVRPSHKVSTLERALRLWSERRPRRLTIIGETYFNRRGIILTDDIREGGALGFHDAYPVTIDGIRKHKPALLAKLTGIRSNDFCGVQATFLTADGEKDPE